jgi:hypothetical protein
VARWTYKKIKDDCSVWKDGKLMRGIPAEDVRSFDIDQKIGVYGIRPSYWNKPNQVPLVLP